MSLSLVEERVRKLPRRERDPMEERLVRLADGLIDRHRLLLQFDRERFEALVLLFDYIIRTTATQASAPRVIELPSELVGVEHEPSVAELEKRNAELIQERWAQAKRESFKSSELQKRLGVSRQRLSQMRQEDKLFGFKTPLDREIYYPAWQFDAGGRPFEVMPDVLAAAREARLDELGLHQLMVNEESSPAGMLAMLLSKGKSDYVVAAIRAASAHGA